MRYDETLPSPVTRGHIATYWHFSVARDGSDSLSHAIPPDGTTSLVFHVASRSLLFSGPRTTPLVIETKPGDEYWGARLWPGAGLGLVPMPFASLRDTVIPAAAVPPVDWLISLMSRLPLAADCRDACAIWDDELGRRLRRCPEIDREVLAAALVAIRARGDLTVGALVRTVGLSSRQLRRRFLRATGLTPKELISARRVRAALIDAVDDDARRWTDIAADSGFSDQAHLSREVRRLLGSSPSAIRAHLRSMHGTLVDR